MPRRSRTPDMQRLLTPFSDDARWRDLLTRAGFSARSLASIGLALAASFALQLSSPMSSVTTVMIVANPTVGALVSKSIWRVFGTIIGGVIGVAIMALFAQSPPLYFLALGLVVGLACMVATFLRLFRAYAAVLTGYTIILISTPSFADPDTIFISALSRLSSLTVGIVVTATVFMVTSQRRPATVLQQIGQAVRAAITQAQLFHRAHGAEAQIAVPKTTATGATGFRTLSQPIYSGRDKLLAQLGALSAAVEYAAVENADLRHDRRRLHMGLAALGGFVTALHPYWCSLTTPGLPAAPVHEFAATLMAELEALTAHPDWMRDSKPVRERLYAALTTLDAMERAYEHPVIRAAIEDTRDAVHQITAAIAQLAPDVTEKDPAWIPPVRMPAYHEWAPALRNGARGCVITWLAGLIWYVTAWTSGPLFLIYVISASSLISTTPSASRSARPMAYGTLLAIPAGCLCHMYFLPQIDGYPLLWLTLCLFLLPGIWVQFSPRYGFYAFGYIVFFCVMLDVANPIRYNDITLLNTWLGFALGCALLAIVFRIVLPPDDRLDAARIVAALGDGIRTLARTRRLDRTAWAAWEGLQIQKVQRMLMRLSFATGPIDRREYSDAGLASVSLGRQIYRLHRLAADHRLPASSSTVLTNALDAFRFLRRDPITTARRLEDCALALEALPEADAAHPETRRAIGILEQSTHLIRALPGFFHESGPLQRHPDRPDAFASLTLTPG
ncbi:FUSC family protein [Acidomonas methanolica]|nr:FUSC family protein [Acidomonas methanolica]